MAEAVLFSVASKLLSTISSPAFKFGYKQVVDIREAMDELNKLKTTIETVQVMLIDAERKQEGSALVKNWIRRVGDVLYEADDLFDEVATDGMLKQQSKGYKPLQKVQLSLSKLNPIVSRSSIAKKVKAIRKSLSEISTDIAGFEFVLGHKEEDIHTSRSRGETEQGLLLDFKKVIGRDEDKKSILEMMFRELDEHAEPEVISIVGIGGMGKTTLADLIYNDDQVKNIFPHRWFACISDEKQSDQNKVIWKIFQSICGESDTNLPVSQLVTGIRASIEGKKFLLILDDVWGEDSESWKYRLSLLSGSAKGSKIIVTTRSSLVALAVGASNTHHLGGLSYDDSWKLFQMIAFPRGKDRDRKLIDVGREIVKKCANVPLAIRSIGGLLCKKQTLREWELFRDGPFSHQSTNPVMKALRFSYDPLPSNLKHCFAYCSLFPKNHYFDVQLLINFWNSQGYIKLNNEMQTVEEEGYLYFMELLMRGFFQEGVEVKGEIAFCKMHDLLHDLARTVAGEEIEMVTAPPPSNQLKHNARHVCVVSVGSWEIVAPLLDTKRVRSVAFTVAYEEPRVALDQRFAVLKRLRALSLQSVKMNSVSSCIGELKHLRYLDLSNNNFEILPDSITMLLNLATLNLRWNGSLKELPAGFRELMSLRYLNINRCSSLKHMPPGMGKLTSLQYLSDFKVGKAIKGIKASGLNELSTGLEKLKGKLEIEFDESIEDWNGDDDSDWKLPVSPNELEIRYYPGVRVPHWNRPNHLSLLPNLRSLFLFRCVKLKYLPPLRYLPHLTFLHLMWMTELEYVEEDEEEEEGCIHDASFFPHLEQLRLEFNPKLKGWWREVEATRNLFNSTSARPMFPSLSDIWIHNCPNLESIPQCSSSELRGLEIKGDCSDGVLQQLLSNTGGSNSSSTSSLQQIFIEFCQGITSCSDQHFASLQSFRIGLCYNLKNLHMESPHLHTLFITSCPALLSVQLEAFTASLLISNCTQLKILHIAHPDVLESLVIRSCPQFEMRSMDWDYFPNLRHLVIDWDPDVHQNLPDCLQHLQDIGQLHIKFMSLRKPMKIDQQKPSFSDDLYFNSEVPFILPQTMSQPRKD